MAFEDCINDSRDRGEISAEDAAALLRRYYDALKIKSPIQARDEVARALAIAGSEKQRRDLLAAKAKNQVMRDILNYRTPHGAQDMVEAMYSLWEGFGHAGYPGVKQLHEAYVGLIHAKMADVLNAFPRTTISGKRRQLVSNADLRKASFGEKSTPQAEVLYRAFSETAEWTRVTRNALGGATPKRKDWGLPQSHDEAAVSRAFGAKSPVEATKAWSDYINPRLDWTKMYDTLTGELFPTDLSAARKEAILGHVFNTIVTGGGINRNPTMSLTGRGSIATQRTDHRFFVFKDAKSASEYNREFGTGDEFTQMMDHLHSMASDLAIMHRFGPNPAAMVEYLKQVLELEGDKAAVGMPHALRRVTPLSARNDVKQAIQILDNFFEQYRGDVSTRNKLALTGEIARNVATGALLGASAIPHAASNWMIQSFARYAGGIPTVRVIPQLLRAFGHTSHEEMLRAGLDIENGLFHIGAGAKQLGKFDKIANWSKWLPDRTTHWFGLTPIVEANKGAFFRGVMAHLADLQKTDWRNLPDRVQKKMAGYGLTERDWRVMQTADLYTPAIGSAKWLRPNEVMDAGGSNRTERHESILQAYGRTSLDPTNDAEEAARIAQDVGMKMLTYMHGEREIAVPSNSMRARARIIGQSDPGTLWGQLRRSFGLFKGFIGSFMVTQIHTMVNELARSKWAGAAYTAAVMIAMGIGGMLSLQLKQAASGKDFAPMNPLYDSGRITWLRAFLTGGSFGVFGDFLASEHSSFGMGPYETLAGPVAEWPLSAVAGVVDTIKSLHAGKNRQPLGTTAGNAAIKFARGMTPFMSTAWPLRAVFNRMFLDQLQYLVDRDAYHKQRMQEVHLAQDTGQQYWWRPGQMLPDRWPHFTPSR